MSEATFFTIGEVAAMVGVSPHTIRAWERRHHVLTPERTASRQRRYTHEDVELLLQVKRAVSTRGLSLKIAVRAAQGTLNTPAEESASILQLPSSEPSWRSVIDVLPYLIAILGPDGAIVDANQGTARALGRTTQWLVGRSLLDFVEVADRSRASAAWQPPFGRRFDCRVSLRTLAGSEAYTFDCWPLAQAGEPRLAVIGRPLDPDALSL
jgi:DNA-binding transcriptional MerR regulator